MNYPFSLIFCALCLPSLVFAQAECKVEMTVHGIEEAKGLLLVAAYDHAESFPRERGEIYKANDYPVRSASSMKVTMKLEPGTYAFSFVHDLNGNKELDRKMFKIPKEPYGFSNDARATFSAPDYEDAKLQVKCPVTRFEVTLK